MRLALVEALVKPGCQFVDRVVTLLLDVIGDGWAKDRRASERLILVVEHVLQLWGELYAFCQTAYPEFFLLLTQRQHAVPELLRFERGTA